MSSSRTLIKRNLTSATANGYSFMSQQQMPTFSRKPRRAQKRSARRAETRLQDGRAPNYRVVAVSLYNRQAESVEQAAKSLKRAGYLKVGRSFVIQTLIERSLENKRPEEILRFFEETSLRRPLARIPSRRPELVASDTVRPATG